MYEYVKVLQNKMVGEGRETITLIPFVFFFKYQFKRIVKNLHLFFVYTQDSVKFSENSFIRAENIQKCVSLLPEIKIYFHFEEFMPLKRRNTDINKCFFFDIPAVYMPIFRRRHLSCQ